MWSGLTLSCSFIWHYMWHSFRRTYEPITTEQRLLTHPELEVYSVSTKFATHITDVKEYYSHCGEIMK